MRRPGHPRPISDGRKGRAPPPVPSRPCLLARPFRHGTNHPASIPNGRGLTTSVTSALVPRGAARKRCAD